MKDIFKFIVAKEFFPVYAPSVKRFTYKMRGLDQNNQPISFTFQDKIDIAAGIQKMGEDLHSKIIGDHIREEEPTYSADQKPEQKKDLDKNQKSKAFVIAKPSLKK